MHSFIRPFVQSVIHAFSHSFIHSFILSFIHSFIHSFIQSLFVHSFIQSLFIHSFMHSFMHSFIHSFMHSFAHSFAHSFNHLFNLSFILTKLGACFLCIGDGLLLASGSKDKTIRVWNIEQENPVLTLNIPSKASAQKGRKKADDMGRVKIWTTLCWQDKSTLISSSIAGYVLRHKLIVSKSNVCPSTNKYLIKTAFFSCVLKITMYKSARF